MIRYVKVHTSLRLTQLAEFACIMFFANPMLRTGFSWILGGNSLIVTILALSCAYIPVVFLCVLAPQKYIKIDFIVLYLMILLFLSVTIAIHPEYEYYYTRKNYGVWDHVLIPYRGIYAYLFIRLVNDSKRILSCMKKAGWIMFFYFGYQLLLFVRRGYWTGVSGTNEAAKLSYSVSFGYEILPFALTFIYLALRHKKIDDIIASLLCVALILIGGSRGPFLFLGLFVVLYLTKLENSKKKMAIITGVSILVIGVYVVYERILIAMSTFISKLGFSSRFITTLLNGSISNDSGRSRIWMATIDMIKSNPLGYGAMGTRRVISQIIAVGYPHSIILEILADFGVIVGGMLLLFFFVNSISILFSNDKKEWSGIFLIFFCASCSLFISLTYWSVPTFWSSIAIGVNCYLSTRNNRNKSRKLRIRFLRKT